MNQECFLGYFAWTAAKKAPDLTSKVIMESPVFANIPEQCFDFYFSFPVTFKFLNYISNIYLSKIC